MPGGGGGGGSAVTVGVVVGDVVAGAAGVVLAGALVELVVVGVPLGEVLGAVAFGSGDPLVVAIVWGAGGEVARGGGQTGSNEFVDNWRSCPMALSRVPPGSPAWTCARSGGRRSSGFIRRQFRWPPDSL